MQDKHAYLIIANNEFAVLANLICALDDVRNDIFIHFDKKCNPPECRTNHSRLFVLEERIDVGWGSITLLKAELALFKAASEHGGYSRYHVLSGVDMPVKSQDYIHEFFAKNASYEMIGFQQGSDAQIQIDYKIKKYYIFQNSYGKYRKFTIASLLRSLFIRLQVLVGYKRNRLILFYKGCQWCSVSEKFVKCLLQNEDSIIRLYDHTFCPDEVFIQTLAMNNGFLCFDYKDEYNGCLRAIKWENGGPTIWKKDDIDDLLKSNRLFARKFNSENIDAVEQLLYMIKEEHEKD